MKLSGCPAWLDSTSSTQFLLIDTSGMISYKSASSMQTFHNAERAWIVAALRGLVWRHGGCIPIRL